MTTYVLISVTAALKHVINHMWILRHRREIRKFEKSHRFAVLQLVLDTIEYKTLLNEYLWLRFMNVKQRLQEKNEFLKMQYNPWLGFTRKKCNLANFA